MSARSLKNDSVSRPWARTSSAASRRAAGPGQRARGRQRPEDHVGDRQQRGDLDQVDRQRDPGEVVIKRGVVLEMDRPGLPAQQVTGLAQDRAQRRMALGGPGGQRGRGQPEQAEQRHPPDGRAQRDRVVADGERGVPGEQDQRGAPGDRGLLEVEPLEQVEQPEREHQHDRRLPGPPAAPSRYGATSTSAAPAGSARA